MTIEDHIELELFRHETMSSGENSPEEHRKLAHVIAKRLRTQLQEEKEEEEFMSDTRHIIEHHEANKATGFERYGLQHISASQLNMYRISPAAWAHYYVFAGARKPSIKMILGSAVEHGVNFALDGADEEVCLSEAQEYFCNDVTDNKIDADNNTIKDALQAIKQWVPMGRDAILESVAGLGAYYIAQQVRCERNIPLAKGGQVKMLGYMDYVVNDGDEPIKIIDLKTTSRAPSKMSTSHALQGVFYQWAMALSPMPTEFIYLCTRQKNPVVTHRLTLENTREEISRIEITANAMDCLLRAINKDTLAGIFVPDPDNFYMR